MKVYKRVPAVYPYACERLGIPSGQVCFLSSNVWDLAGAALVGFHSVRVNPQNQPQEYKFAAVDAEIRSLAEFPPLLRKAKIG